MYYTAAARIHFTLPPNFSLKTRSMCARLVHSVLCNVCFRLVSTRVASQTEWKKFFRASKIASSRFLILFVVLVFCTLAIVKNSTVNIHTHSVFHNAFQSSLSTYIHPECRRSAQIPRSCFHQVDDLLFRLTFWTLSHLHGCDCPNAILVRLISRTVYGHQCHSQGNQRS